MEQEQYLMEAEFIMSSYDPPKLLKGMTFVTRTALGLPEPEIVFFVLEDENVDKDTFMGLNGAPITLNIITTGEDGEIIALQDEIGFFNDGTILLPITAEQINTIINKHNGVMNIECDETGDPIMYEGKVIISYLGELESDPENP